jgi:hypothetical protein
MCYPGTMDWTSVISGAVGGLAGSAIPAWLAYWGVRRERKQLLQATWRDDDAPVVADVNMLLLDIDPDRRANIDRASGVEQQRWDDIRRQDTTVRRQLMTMAARHPSEPIRSCAKELEVQTAAATIHTQWLVKDLLAERDPRDQHTHAKKCHQAATATADQLQQLVIAYGSGTKPKDRQPNQNGDRQAKQLDA